MYLQPEQIVRMGFIECSIILHFDSARFSTRSVIRPEPLLQRSGSRNIFLLIAAKVLRLYAYLTPVQSIHSCACN